MQLYKLKVLLGWDANIIYSPVIMTPCSSQLLDLRGRTFVIYLPVGS